MSNYTKLDRSQLNEIATRYSLGAVLNFKLLEGGSENSNYLVSTFSSLPLSEEGRYVITVCEQKSEQEAQQLARLLEHLKAYDFATSQIVFDRKGQAITLWGDKPIMVKHYLEGKVLEHLPLHLLELLGAALGRLHQIPAPDYLPLSLSYGEEQFDEVDKYAPNSDFAHWLTQQRAYILPFIELGLPKALIHSDLFFSNVIVDETETTACIMDFEEATYYYRLFDLGMSIVGLCRREIALDREMVSALVKGYRSVITLTPEEEQSLQPMVIYAATAMCFWRHKNFNYVNPIPSMFDHYKALQEVAEAAARMNFATLSTD